MTVAAGAGVGVMVAVAISIAAASAIVVGGGVRLCDNSDKQHILSEIAQAAQIAKKLGNDELTKKILDDIENIKHYTAESLNNILDMAVKHKLIDFEGVDENKVRASLQALLANQLLHIG